MFRHPSPSFSHRPYIVPKPRTCKSVSRRRVPGRSAGHDVIAHKWIAAAARVDRVRRIRRACERAFGRAEGAGCATFEKADEGPPSTGKGEAQTS
ncbi:hypothetical protein NUW54_g7463 [Trametes sanguinea]|uniref:Uncharacterized protein n=1 Tax=Trametes sanguinea TaxID=158606 RepID=A0ACC1PLZ3_9APHY|nr:hypothetical protein NUW54_g7463 [Trametes sanguinea]